VNEKIEGFFEACQRRGLTGEQGVILPEKNVVNLMLKAPVRRAVDEGAFHIYAAPTLDEGLEILTGMPAGELQEDGTYPAESVHGRVVDRLQEIANNLKPKDSAEDGEEEGLTEGVESEKETGL
jgi:predicted ATP-dependent protease